MSVTLQDLHDYMRAAGSGDFSRVDERLIQAAVRSALQELEKIYDWSFLVVEEDSLTVAPYETGTVSVNHLSPTVTGEGVTWTPFGAGDLIDLGNSSRIARIASIVGGTLTLQAAYVSETEENLSGAEYVIFKRDYAPSVAAERIYGVVDRWSPCPSLECIDRAQMEELWRAGQSRGTPVVYSIEPGATSEDGARVRLWPAPDRVLPMAIHYKRKLEGLPEAVTDEVDWPGSRELLETAAFLQLTIRAPNGAKYRSGAREAFNHAFERARSTESAMKPMLFVGRGKDAAPPRRMRLINQTPYGG